MNFSHKLLLAASLLLLPQPAEASRHHIAGEVIDRNGEPVERAIVTLRPGNVQLVTDGEGRFMIDYLRNDDGQRVRLARRTDYALEIFKPGFHIETVRFHYRRGRVVLDTFELVEDTIRVEDDDQNIDPGLFVERTQTHGATYEGQ